MNEILGTGVPTYYNHINACTSQNNPSTVHVTDTRMNMYFTRYLLQKAMSVFEWKLPEYWSKDYFLYVLYCWGFVAVVNTDKFGVIPQACGLQGFDVFYRPTNAIITNPLLTGILTPQIDAQCTLIKLQPDYGGIMDLVEFYANMLSLCAQTAATNILNSKLSYVFRASNKTQAEAYKKMFDKIASGEPAIFIDKTLVDASDGLTWDSFTQDLKNNYIAGDVLADMRKWETEFDTRIGIPNANTDKRERLITDEVNANNFETQCLTSLWLEQIKEAIKKTNAMFNTNISVDWRADLKELMQKNEPFGGVNNVIK